MSFEPCFEHKSIKIVFLSEHFAQNRAQRATFLYAGRFYVFSRARSGFGGGVHGVFVFSSGAASATC